MRLGPLLGFEQSFETVVTVAREMEAVGAGSVMLAEAGRSAVTQASAVIAATESIEVGTYVMNAFARSPEYLMPPSEIIFTFLFLIPFLTLKIALS